MDGKKEFKKVLTFINTHKIQLDEDVKKHLLILRLIWNKPNKTLNDYYEMKANHSHIIFCKSHFSKIDDYKLFINNDEMLKLKYLDDIWNIYLHTAISNRVKILQERGTYS